MKPMKPIGLLSTLLLCLALCLGLFASCRSQRQTATAHTSRPVWTTLEVPVKVSVDKPVSLKCSGKAVLMRDSSIYISMRLLGMEVAYIYADADSAVLCDRYHKLYLSEPLQRLLPPDYARISRLQDLMLGLEQPEQITRHVEYSQPVEALPGTVYSLLRLRARAGKKDIDASVTFNYDKARWNAPDFNMPSVRLPRNASRVGLPELLDELKP